jgi:signal transduction histidine kinase
MRSSAILHLVPPRAEAAHLVQFYESESSLCEPVARFLDEGLYLEERVIAIATPPTLRALTARLTLLGHDVEALRARGSMVLLDAEETALALLVDGMPDRERFERVMRPYVGERGGARAYGEMVDVLWRDGRKAAALVLEEMWSTLTKRRSVTVLCAYSLARFAGESDALRAVCAAHTYVLPCEPRAPQSRAAVVLAAEAAAREETEAMLRDRIEDLRVAHERERLLRIEAERRAEAAREAEQEGRETIERLRETLRASDTFAAVLAHDLRNPLSGILTAAALARASAPVELQRALGVIQSSAQRMSRLVEHLLDASRTRAGVELPLARSAVDLCAIVQQVAAEIAPRDPERPVQLECAGDTRGDWDGDRLAQLFSNLLGNALQHGEGGPVVVHVDGTEGAIVRASVRNSGSIPEALRPKLFEPWESGARRSGRVGLGLFIARNIARAHRGTLELEPTAGATTFVLAIPRRA